MPGTNLFKGAFDTPILMEDNAQKPSMYDVLGVSLGRMEKYDHYSTVCFRIFIRRQYWYYVTHVLLLLWINMGFGSLAFAFEPSNLNERVTLGATMFLAAAAILFVIGQELPKKKLLDKMDWAVIVTLLANFLVGLESAIAYHCCEFEHSGANATTAATAMTQSSVAAAVAASEKKCDVTRDVDKAFCGALIAIYVVINSVLFLPQIYKQRRGAEEEKRVKAKESKPAGIYLKLDDIHKAKEWKRKAEDFAEWTQANRENALSTPTKAPSPGKQEDSATRHSRGLYPVNSPTPMAATEVLGPPAGGTPPAGPASSRRVVNRVR